MLSDYLLPRSGIRAPSSLGFAHCALFSVSLLLGTQIRHPLLYLLSFRMIKMASESITSLLYCRYSAFSNLGDTRKDGYRLLAGRSSPGEP
jgi:hypothetical protein